MCEGGAAMAMAMAAMAYGNDVGEGTGGKASLVIRPAQALPFHPNMKSEERTACPLPSLKINRR